MQVKNIESIQYFHDKFDVIDYPQKYLNFDFWRLASFRAMTFATLSIFSEILTRCREGDIMRCREMVRDTDHFCQRALFCGFFYSNMLFDMHNHIFDVVFEISIGGKMR